MNKVILHGPRLTLRPVSIKDAPAFCRWFRDRRVKKYLKNQGEFTLAAEKKYLRVTVKEKNLIFLSVVNENGRLIGNTRITVCPQHKRAEFGIIIGEKDEWGKGYAGEVIRLWQTYVFDKLKYERFELTVFMANSQALRAYTKAGFTLEGVRRKYMYNQITKKFEHDGVMSMLKEEWKKLKK